MDEIKGRLKFQCENASTCGATSRHYRDRRQDINDINNEDDGAVESCWFVDRIDGIHFMVHHLTELGLRVQNNSLQSIGGVASHKLKAMGKEIDSKRNRFSSERLDGNSNLKFTINVDEMTDGNGGMFCISLMLHLIW